MSEKNYPPRAWTYKYMRDGWEKNRIEEKFFRHNYPGNMIEYLSLAEHDDALESLALEFRNAMADKEAEIAKLKEISDSRKWLHETTEAELAEAKARLEVAVEALEKISSAERPWNLEYLRKDARDALAKIGEGEG